MNWNKLNKNLIKTNDTLIINCNQWLMCVRFSFTPFTFYNKYFFKTKIVIYVLFVFCRENAEIVRL